MKYLTILLLFTVSAYSQNVELDLKNKDTNGSYIDYSDQLLVKQTLYVKSNDLDIKNTTTAQLLELSPNGTASFGLGINYKWLGIGLGLGLRPSEESIRKKGKTRRTDLQLSVYTKHIVIDAFAQRYLGYYIKNPDNLIQWDDPILPQLKSMETTTIGMVGFYVFNHERLSYKAAYVRNAVQKKSAGSFLLGTFFSFNQVGLDQSVDSSFIPDYFPENIKTSFPLSAFSFSSYGVSVGYTYTYIFFKKYFVNLTLLPGLGGKQLRTTSDDGFITSENGFVTKMTTRAAVGYEGKNIMFGITAFSSTGNIKYNIYQIKPRTSNIRIVVAKRFKLKRKSL